MADLDADEAIRLYKENRKMVIPNDKEMCVDMYELETEGIQRRKGSDNDEERSGQMVRSRNTGGRGVHVRSWTWWTLTSPRTPSAYLLESHAIIVDQTHLDWETSAVYICRWCRHCGNLHVSTEICGFFFLVNQSLIDHQHSNTNRYAYINLQR